MGARSNIRSMDLSELTPELFEKTEFTERRRGYDIDQVETFLEETGTAVAQLLVRHRQLEERATNAEARLAETERRLAEKPAPAPQPARSETDEVERATSTLLMAKRTADATLAEAEAEAERVRSEATGRADSILAEARSTAAEELDAARRRTTEVVTTLEARRDAVAAVVEGLEKRIDEYRGQFVEAARALQAVADDPEVLVTRPAVAVPEDARGHTPEPEPTQVDHSSSTESAPSSVPFRPEASVDLTDATQVHDTAAAAAYSIPAAVQVSAEERGTAPAGPMEASVRESAVIVDAEPVTGQTSDRFLRELDEAVNESGSGEKGSEESGDAMSAFFDGDKGESGRSRFGWRR